MLILSLVLLAAAVASCADGQPPRDSSVSTWGDPGGSDEFASALLEGTLVVDEGCVYVDRAEDPTRYVLAFADGAATVDGEVVSHGAEDVPSGTAVAAGGGELGSDGVTLGAGCDEEAPVWWVAPEVDLRP